MSPQAPSMNTASHISSHYAISSDVMDRHEYGVNKNRKTASTGGGRAWSEDEEVYLLQTRLQKMPYKHIAAHLKKTELACRLHYHQLSHGSNRRSRNRTTSVSSGSDHSSQQSPVMHHVTPVPGQEQGHAYPFSPEQAQIHLPPTSTLLPRSASSSPRRTLAAILPKPTPAAARQSPPLRLDCALPPMNTGSPVQSNNIDLPRLSSLYDAHRSTFWGTIATSYGPAASASQLEQEYFRFRLNAMAGGAREGVFTPPTPCISPDGSSNEYKRVEPKEVVGDKTSISALLGIDASPRSPHERELIRQMESGRVSA